MKRKKAALYNPYLDTLGGGEKLILSIIKELDKEGYDITIFWDEDLSPQIQQKLDITFSPSVFQQNIFRTPLSFFKKQRILQQFDIFFYVSDGSYFFSSAKKNYVYAMIPDKKLYKGSILDAIKRFNYAFLTISQYTQSWLRTWGISSEYVYPYLDDKLLTTPLNTKKEKKILSVGRFFGHLHSKQQHTMIPVFQQMKQKIPQLRDYTLVLAGGLKEEDQAYFDSLKQLKGKDPTIILRPNVSFEELLSLYDDAQLYWHFAGYGVNEDKNPEQVEHLGITPLEAMARGCVVFNVRAGGAKETIEPGWNGFLFSHIDELESHMQIILTNTKKREEKIRTNALSFVQQNFSYSVFAKRVRNVVCS